MGGASLHPCQLQVNTNDSKPLGYVPFHPHPLTPSPIKGEGEPKQNYCINTKTKLLY
jgi:hypothetical protein